MQRLAIYHTPHPESAIALRASAWLGRDVYGKKSSNLRIFGKILGGKPFVQFSALILLFYITKKKQEGNLFRDHTLQKTLDELDVIECFEVPDRKL